MITSPLLNISYAFPPYRPITLLSRLHHIQMHTSSGGRWPPLQWLRFGFYSHIMLCLLFWFILYPSFISHCSYPTGVGHGYASIINGLNFNCAHRIAVIPLLWRRGGSERAAALSLNPPISPPQAEAAPCTPVENLRRRLQSRWIISKFLVLFPYLYPYLSKYNQNRLYIYNYPMFSIKFIWNIIFCLLYTSRCV